MNDELKNIAYIRFAENNEYTFFMDFRWYRGVPSDVIFYPVSESGNSIVFIGNGYGIQPKHNLPGDYGNGSIFIYKSDIPHLIEWCRNNWFTPLPKRIVAIQECDATEA